MPLQLEMSPSKKSCASKHYEVYPKNKHAVLHKSTERVKNLATPTDFKWLEVCSKFWLVVYSREKKYTQKGND